jgi:hypothetical protein
MLLGPYFFAKWWKFINKKNSGVYSAPTAVAARQRGLEPVEFGMPNSWLAG